MTRIAVVFGTRPEAIKLGPVVAEVRRADAMVSLCCTGQHTDLLHGTPAETDLSGGDSLGWGAAGQDPMTWVEQHLEAMGHWMEATEPTACIVQGDTASAYVAALSAVQHGVPVLHIEAGVRSGDVKNPWPEEMIRRQITRFADWHYASTDRCALNLANEGVPADRIVITGNPVVSAMHRYALGPGVLAPWPPENRLLFTMHRREWLDQGLAHVLRCLQALCSVVREFPDLEIQWPMHPAVRKVLSETRIFQPSAFPRLHITDPLPYREAILSLATCLGVATDSGGLQEEACTLGIPCAVLRYATDRPESVEAGRAQMYDPTPDGIRAAIRTLASDHGMPRTPSDIYGTADSAKHIASHLLSIV